MGVRGSVTGRLWEGAEGVWEGLDLGGVWEEVGRCLGGRGGAQLLTAREIVGSVRWVYETGSGRLWEESGRLWEDLDLGGVWEELGRSLRGLGGAQLLTAWVFQLHSL